nr:hypothetical protein [uncultured Cohaesibacter sp.]
MGNRKHKQNGRSKSEGQYLILPYSLLHHPAWRRLSGSAKSVFLELRSRFNGSNNGQLRLSLGEGAKLLGMSKTTIDRKFDELEEAGFIVKTKHGNWYGRKAHEWASTDIPCNGYPATRDWQNRWKEKPL